MKAWHYLLQFLNYLNLNNSQVVYCISHIKQGQQWGKKQVRKTIFRNHLALEMCLFTILDTLGAIAL